MFCILFNGNIPAVINTWPIEQLVWFIKQFYYLHSIQFVWEGKSFVTCWSRSSMWHLLHDSKTMWREIKNHSSVMCHSDWWWCIKQVYLRQILICKFQTLCYFSWISVCLLVLSWSNNASCLCNVQIFWARKYI